MRSGSVRRRGLIGFFVAAIACTTSPPPSSTQTPAGPVSAEPSTADPTKAPTNASTTPVVRRIAPFVAAVHGMSVAPDKRLFFSDSFGQLDPAASIYVLEPPYTGTPVRVPIEQLQRPAGLTHIGWDLYVCDVGAGRVMVYGDKVGGGHVWQVSSPWNVVKTDSGALLVTTFDGQLVRLEFDGTTQPLQIGLASPFDLQLIDDGRVWISEQGSKPGVAGRVALWDPNAGVDLESHHTWATPEGLALDPEGNLWVAETEGQALLRVSPDGEVESMAEVDGLPVSMATLPSGDLLVSVTGPSPHLLRVEFGRS